jgi:hypothetical protein
MSQTAVEPRVGGIKTLGCGGVVDYKTMGRCGDTNNNGMAAGGKYKSRIVKSLL